MRRASVVRFVVDFASCFVPCAKLNFAPASRTGATALSPLFPQKRRLRQAKLHVGGRATIGSGWNASSIPSAIRKFHLTQRNWQSPMFWPWISIPLWQFMKPRSTFEFHVDVFQKDWRELRILSEL